MGLERDGVAPARRWRGGGPALPATALLFVCFAVPLLGILWESLSAGPAGGLTPRHYAKALTDGYYLGVLWTTFRL